MRVKASLPSVRDVEVDLPRQSSVSQLKGKICNKLGIEPELTSLILEGRLLNENQKLARLDLRSKKIIVDYLWARHLILWGRERQSLIRDSTVLIAGAGAIGNEVAKNLAMLGAKRLVIVDNDTVELSNTSRMVFFQRRDLGKNKAEALARNIRQKYPHVGTYPLGCAVEDIPLRTYLDTDIIVCGLDNVISRIHLAQICRKYLIPMVDGGIIGYQARVQAYVPPDGPCLLCPFPSGNYARLVGLRNPCDAPAEEAKVPSLPTTISLVSSIQTQEAAKLLQGYREFAKLGKWPSDVGEPLKGVLIADLRYNRYTIMELKRNENCVVCGKEGVARDVVPIIDMPFRRLRNSTTSLHRAVQEKLGAEKAEVKIFMEGVRGAVRLEGGRGLRQYGLRRGDVLNAVFTSKSGEYREAVVKLS